MRARIFSVCVHAARGALPPDPRRYLGKMKDQGGGYV